MHDARGKCGRSPALSTTLRNRALKIDFDDGFRTSALMEVSHDAPTCNWVDLESEVANALDAILRRPISHAFLFETSGEARSRTVLRAHFDDLGPSEGCVRVGLERF